MEPTRIGPYLIRSRLGRGGMGAVYEGEDPVTGEVVAVKTLVAHLGDDAGVRRRFLQEIEALKALRHPGIVRLLAFGEDEGRPYFAMELVRGSSLEQLLRSGRRFGWQETVATAIEITKALKTAHDHGIVHRDLKPANLLVLDLPEAGVTVKLADFGIARLFGEAGQTQAGSVVGTAEYMAPEQAAGLPLDHRADLYALGLVMFAMLAGRPPFHGGTLGELVARQRNEPPPRVASLAAGIPPAVDELVARLLAKDPARRPPSALALGRLLAAIESPPAADSPPAPPPQAGPEVDLLAPTRVGAAGTARGTRTTPLHAAAPVNATVPLRAVLPTADAGLAHLATVATAGSGDAALPPPRTSFTTVEQLQRSARATAERDRRRHLLVQTTAALGLVALVVGAARWLLAPPSADDLHARIMAIAADADDLRDARPLIDRFLADHPDDPRTAAIRALDERLDLDMLEKRARRRPLSNRPLLPIERDYRAAMANESGSAAACVAALEALLAVHGTDAEPPAAAAAATPADADIRADPALWLALTRRQIDRLSPRAAQERQEDVARAKAALDEAASLAAAAEQAFTPRERASLAARRRDLLAGVVEMYAARPHAANEVGQARRLLAADPAPPPESR